ncbi:hypothetical protein [Leptospira stimsonii]|uniref:Uncharacterized protein n=1 Tax=Leptospira stimsonii TaxID=2202203 RepID=A0ABY2MWG7_9LEPT|nr:hypothetical protein [Leptospira stimsonii]TGK23901.1 hypothetical protein EHO98_04370 [Leptospira stimsonii]TGM10391.1 hypothetical protein EHQ90_18150 [Leptospira stimsonii]
MSESLSFGGGKLREFFPFKEFYFLQVNFPPITLVGTTTKTPFGTVSHSKSIPKIRLKLQLPGQEVPQTFRKKKFKKNRIPLNFCPGKTLFLEIRT